jgi:alkylation response protein AidB-like acyl-CoA dehydrogenase
MDLELNETQVLLRDTVREFLESEIHFDQVRACEKERTVDAKLLAQLHAHGWLGTPFPADVGGGDAGLIEAGLLVEEVARRAACVPIVESLAAGISIGRFASAEVSRELLRKLISGEILVVPSVLEANDSFEALATEVAGEGALRGEKYFVDYAEAATHHLVAARRDGEIGLHLVDARDPAVKCEPKPAIGRTPQSIVRYDAVASQPICGAEGYDFLVNVARALTAVQIVSCMQVSLEQTVAYTSIREQFGRPIGTFQAVQHHAANMAMEVESCHFLAYEALDALERGVATREQVAIAKAAASEAVPEVTMLGHQLHGGQGYIEENDLYFFTLRGKDRSLAWGTLEECLDIIAATVDSAEDWL